MSWTAPFEWTAGYVVTAAKLNEQLYYNIRYLKGLDGTVTLSDGLDLGANELTINSIEIVGVDGEINKAALEQLDHGTDLAGLGDDDHTQYALRTILTTRGDIIYRTATVWTRLAKGAAGTVLRMGADDPAWASSIATHEFMVLPTSGATQASIGDFLNLWRIDAGGEQVSFIFNIPNDFVSLTSAKVVGIKGTNGNIDWTVITDFGAIGEAYTTHSDTATADGVAMTNNEIEAIDVSAGLTGLAADDYVGLVFTVDVISAGTWDIIGLIIKYT